MKNGTRGCARRGMKQKHGNDPLPEDALKIVAQGEDGSLSSYRIWQSDFSISNPT
jgi:hypothetical protein